MSERSFALGCVGAALAFGLVVPDPGKASRQVAAPTMTMVRPAPQPPHDKALERMQGEPFAVHHAAPAKRDANPAMFWPARASNH
jgi:hypothetical protein